MQEEVNNGAAQVVVKVGKLSGRLLKAAVAKVLKAWQEKSDPQKLHRGKQTVKQLAAQNKGMSSIDVDKAGIRSFERVARKYGVDFAPKKGRDGKYYVFFKGKDADALTAAFTEYTQKRVKQHSKPSLLAQLAKFKELSKATMVSLYPLWKADDYTGQPRRGQDLLCHASCGGLHQPKAFTRYGDP